MILKKQAGPGCDLMAEKLSQLQSNIRSKHDLLQSLLLLSQQQICALQAEDLPRLAEVLQEKQQLMQRIDNIDADLSALWKLVGPAGESQQGAERQQLTLSVEAEESLAASRQLMLSLLNCDQEQQALSQSLLLKYERQLRELGAGVDAVKTYTQSLPEGQAASVFVNRKF